MVDGALDSSPALLLGAGGMLGRAMVRELSRRGRPYTALGRTDFDFSDPDRLRALPIAGQSVVINCVAWTDVDGAETQEANATRINGEAVGVLGERCGECHVPLVHFSTDYVFSGEASRPYRVDDPRDPQNAYGRSKMRGEELLENSGAEHLLIRTSWLYAPWGKNFVRTMVELGKTRDQLRVVNDQRGRPTSAEHLAATTLALLACSARGTFHVTDGGECTWYEFSKEIFAIAGRGTRVQPCSTEEFPRPASRPAYSVLDLSKTEALVGPMPRWQTNLRSVLEQEPV